MVSLPLSAVNHLAFIILVSSTLLRKPVYLSKYKRNLMGSNWVLASCARASVRLSYEKCVGIWGKAIYSRKT